MQPLAMRTRLRRTAVRRTRVTAAVALAVLLVILGIAAAAVTATASPTRFYVALGDSLSTGFQPTLRGEGIETHSGYVDDIYGHERARTPGLGLVDFGCPGDTTTSLLTGVGNYPLADRLHCDRTHGSQLAAALAFLRSHHQPGEVPVITLDIGINDINRCANLPDPARCLFDGQHAIATNLPRILHALRAAAPQGTRLAAMTLYDTYLGKPSTDGATPANAAAFLGAYREANRTINADDAASGFGTASVAKAFDTYETSAVSWHGTRVAANLARTCALTWSCAGAPIFHNIHPNDHGYRVIARTFERTIGRLRAVRYSG